MRPPPELHIGSEYQPFIKNDRFRKNYMYYAYALMAVLFITAVITGGMRAGNTLIRLLLFIIVYPVHELLHISVALPAGDIYMTHSGIYFWLTPDVPLKKWHFWLFMTLPFITLTAVPAVLSFILSGEIVPYLRYIAWINAVIAGSDIINSLLILIKPSDAVFYKGYYKTSDERK